MLEALLHYNPLNVVLLARGKYDCLYLHRLFQNWCTGSCKGWLSLGSGTQWLGHREGREVFVDMEAHYMVKNKTKLKKKLSLGYSVTPEPTMSSNVLRHHLEVLHNNHITVLLSALFVKLLQASIFPSRKWGAVEVVKGSTTWGRFEA